MPVRMLSGALVQLTPVFISIFWKKAKVIIRPRKKNKCGSGFPTYPRFLLPTLNFFLHILKLEENSSSAILFQLQNLEKKYISS